MTHPSWLISRRTMLRGAGVAIALPLLDAMVAEDGCANDSGEAVAGKVVARKMPVRFATLYVPNGLVPPPQGKEPDKWTPRDGVLNELPEILAPLDKVKASVLVLSGMYNALPIRTRGGHHPAVTGFLCSSILQRGKDSVAENDIIDSGGPSIDQVLASRLGAATRIPSLELAMDPPEKGLAGPAKENRIYGSHLSWSSPTTPVPPEINPKAAFDRLFRAQVQQTGAQQAPSSIQDDQSVLDAVMRDLPSFQSALGTDDRRKLDEYTTSVRDLEVRLAREVKASAEPRRIDPAAMRALPDLDSQVAKVGEVGRKGNPAVVMRLMLDVLTMAFWTDTTRIAAFQMGVEVNNRKFPFLEGVNDGHHELSHHENKKEKMDPYVKISCWHIAQFAYLIARLGQIKEGAGTLLDNSMLLLGSGLRDGNKHDKHNLPILLAGGGGGTLKGGRHVKVGDDVPLANLHCEVAVRMGLQLPKFADSTGPLKGL
jgi:hypothetical protein